MADLFDTRLYRAIGVYEANSPQTTQAFLFKPHIADIDSEYSETNITFATYAGDFYESPTSVKHGIEDLETGESGDTTNEEYKKLDDFLEKRKQGIQQKINEYAKSTMAPFSAIHPYALLKLTGASGNQSTVEGHYGIDTRTQRRWYEIDGDTSGGYAKNPSTTVIMNWGNLDTYGRTPYAYQDFVYCKWWNKIQNNRMITLRRYSMPVSDSLAMQADSNGNTYQKAFAPVATAVTYFGDGTGNTLSDLLSFTVGYNWKDLEGTVWEANSTQNNEGQGYVLNSSHYVSKGLRAVTQMLGFIGDVQSQMSNGQEGYSLTPTEAVGAPPDPYNQGPYANRIIGPVNVITKVKARDRGLKFTHDGLKLTFEYVARPIANINNKAIMLDLLANLLLMTSSVGTFWGGVGRYYTENPAMYPWRDTDTLNNLYKGKLFGKQSVYNGLINTVYKQPANFFMNFAESLFADIKSAASKLLNKILGNCDCVATGTTDSSTTGAGESAWNTIQKMVSGHLIKGNTIPWVRGMRSILSGEPTGEWHLTIGNPLNPIAMIGNLIVDNAQFSFSDELGPDDFPTSFKCVIDLKHALDRDKEGVESMFNRGYGRIYTLPTNFRTSADGESTVDDFTGTNNATANSDSVEMYYPPLVTAGNMFVIASTSEENKTLKNSGDVWNVQLRQMNLSENTINSGERWNAGYLVVPSQAHWLL